MRTAGRRAHSRLPRRAVDAVLAGALLVQAATSLVAQTSPLPRAELVLQTGHTGSVNALALSPDGRFLVSGSEDLTLKIWDTATGNVLRTLSGHEKGVLAAAVSPDGTRIASGAADQTVRVWDVLTGQSFRAITHTSAVKNVVFSDDGRQLVSLGNNEMKVYDVAGRREVSSVRSGADPGSKGIPDSGTFDQVATALSPNGKLAALGGGYTYRNGVMGFGGGLRTRPLRVIDVASGREVESFKLAGNLPSPTDLSFSPDSRLIVAKFVERGARDASMRSWVSVFEVASGREQKKLASSDALGMGGIAFSPDGTLLATIGLQDGAAVWRVDTGERVRTRAGRWARAEFSPDGQLVATSGDIFFGIDGVARSSAGDVVQFWNPITGEHIRDLPAVAGFGFSPDGTLFAGADQSGLVQLFDAATANLIRTLTDVRARALAFSPDGQRLLVADPDGQVRVVSVS